MHMPVSSELAKQVSEMSLPENLGFGRIKAPVMFRARCTDSIWDSGELLPYGLIQLDPASKTLHYAQQIFEGLKAYWVSSDEPQLFRPRVNARRLNHSADRLCMTNVPEEIFMAGVEELTRVCKPIIPRHQGSALYLRPFLIGVDHDLGLAASKNYEFYVLASPSEVFHAGTMRVKVERDACRSAVGGTGDAKTGGNYAASLLATNTAESEGHDQVLWLNPEKRKLIDELSGMNFFAAINGKLYTPSLNGCILEGVTRDSIIGLAQSTGIEVIEGDLVIDDVLNAVSDGSCTEAFACGTAAIVSPISRFHDRGKNYVPKYPEGQIAQQIRDKLLDLQEGRSEDTFGWIEVVK
jgi:branched-chain amino acid aminotransferase